MRSLFTALLFVLTIAANAQGKFESGNYTSGDGNYTATFTYNADNTITTIEPNWVQVYKNIGGNEYQAITPRGTDFRLLVLDKKTIKAYKALSPGVITMYTFSGAEKPAISAAESARYRKVAQKYLDLAKSDPDNTQVHSFCGAAAMARATYNEKGYNEYVRKVISSLKQFLVDMNKCPCEDAIPKQIFDSVPN